MKRASSLLPPIVAAFAVLTATESCAQTTKATAPNPTIVPALRTNPTNRVARHEGFVALAKKGGIDLLFLGDSITDRWRNQGSNVWVKYYAPRHAANFGFGVNC